MRPAQLVTGVTFVVVALAAGLVQLSPLLIAQEQANERTEGFIFYMLVAMVVVLILGWLAAQHHVHHRRLLVHKTAQSERWLDTAIDHMSQGLVMFDSQQRVALCNRRYIELYSVSPSIVKPGLSFRDLLLHRKATGSFDGDVDQYCDAIAASFAKGKASHLITNVNGRFVRIVNQPLADGGWVATHEDVTERQQLLEAQERSETLVREQKRQLDAALDSMAHGLCVFDSEGRIALFNRRYCEMMEQSADYLQGRSLLDLLERRKATGAFLGDPDEFFSRVMNSVRRGEITSKEMVRADGVVLRVVDQPMSGGGWVATFEDVTEQRQAERDRDRNRAFLDLIIDNVPSAIFVKSAQDRKYVLVNRAGERFWGMSREAMIGKTAANILPPTEARNVESRDAELLQDGRPVFDEREIVTPCDGIRNILSRRLPIQGKNNETQYLLGVVDDVTERKAAEARIAHLAHYDPLTGLPNRTLFREQLARELSFVRRGARLALLYLDLDHFKTINDTLGHPVGDELLKAVAQRLRNCLRESDLIARLGGDEFAVVQTEVRDPKDAETLARRLRAALTEAAFDLAGHQTTADLSIGIALAPEDGTEIDDLVKHADLALYGAKAEGRANFRYFEPRMNARMKQRRELEIELRAAVVNGEFELQYQPIISLHTDKITHCEALLRWRHRERGLIQPSEFISVAEETGLINAIGDWVLRRASAEAMNWPARVSVAVNVSALQFRSPSFALAVAGSLAASGLPAHRLEMEITESVLVQNSEATLATLHQIRDLGVRISLDDFGTGYSSLSYLRSFPFDKIKIDRCFIEDLSKGVDAVAIVKAILQLAKGLKMTTTAEGVETEVQRELLRECGCDEMQGYLFSRPRSAAEIIDLLVARRRSIKVA